MLNNLFSKFCGVKKKKKEKKELKKKKLTYLLTDTDPYLIKDMLFRFAKYTYENQRLKDSSPDGGYSTKPANILYLGQFCRILETFKCEKRFK